MAGTARLSSGLIILRGRYEHEARRSRAAADPTLAAWQMLIGMAFLLEASPICTSGVVGRRYLTFSEREDIASLILRKLSAYPRDNSLAVGLRELWGTSSRTLSTLKWLQDPGIASTCIRRPEQARGPQLARTSGLLLPPGGDPGPLV
jgi:hypothetical protein